MNFSNLKEQVILKPLIHELSIANRLYQSIVLNFTMEAQTQPNWCWAATSKSVSFYYTTFLNPWSQCKIATSELGHSCCATPGSTACNVPWYLDRALTCTHNFVSLHAGAMSWEEVKEQIDKGLVVGVRVGWYGGGGHFMVIYGVSKILNRKYFHIDDPIYHKSVLSVEQFTSNYQGAGYWSHSYITKKHYYFMWFKDLVFKRELLNPIPEVRPLLSIQLPKLNIQKTVGELELSFPHHAYVVSLQDINNNFQIPADPASLRVIEMDEKKPLVLYDLSTSEADPELLQVSTDDEYLNRIEDGMEKLKVSMKDKEIEGELRLLKFPALNLEALWLHTNGNGQDRYFMTRQFGQQDTVMNEGDFHKLILKQKEVTEKQDELMGA